MRVLACLGHKKEKSLLSVTDLLDVQGNSKFKQRRFQRSTLTRSEIFTLLSCDFEQIFGQIVIIRLKTLSKAY